MRGTSLAAIRSVGADAALLAVVAGIGWQLAQPTLRPAPTGLAIAVLSGAMVLAAIAARRRCHRPAGELACALVALVALAALAFAVTDLRAVIASRGSLPARLEGRDLSITGVIAGLPQGSEGGFRFEFIADSLTPPPDLGGQAGPDFLPVRLSLSWFDGPTEPNWQQRTPRGPQAGDRWRFQVRLRAPHGLANPHAPDPDLWAWSRGIRAHGTVRSGATAQWLGRDPSFFLERSRQQVRDAIETRIDDRARAGVLAALAVGDQQAIDRASWEVFRITGVAHLMSISGLHVTMFAWAAAWCAGWAWRRSRRLCLACPAPVAAAVAGLFVAALYAAFSGGGLPAQRTVGMLAIVVALRVAGLGWPWPRVWLVAACAMALIDPWALLEPGFWLSFVAVGVLFASDPREAGVGASGISGRAGALVREQAIITLALAPLTLVLFGQVSVVGLIANLIAIPWVTLLVTPLALGGVLWAPLWEVGALAIAAMHSLLQVAAAWPLAQWEAPSGPAWLSVPALAGGVLLALPLPLALRSLGLPLLLPLALWEPVALAPGELEILAADIGQGNAVIVRTARHALLYDTGPRWGPDSDAGHRVLVPLLRSLGLRPDEVVVSHRDADHIGGADAVLAHHPQAGLLTSIEPGHPLAARRAPRLCLQGQRWQWDGVDFEMLYPQEGDLERWAAQPNALSCVLRITARGGSVLLAGDLEAPQERLLLARWPDHQLRSDVLLVPHHGSKTSSSPEFLEAVRPAIALIQAGYRNRFGHPAASVVERYESHGSQVVTSAQCGAAVWASSNPGQVACHRAGQRRYWHHVSAPEPAR